MSKLTASRAALDLIQSFEGFRARAARLPDGRFTIGYGHVATAREGLEIGAADAADLLKWDLRPIEDALRQWVHAPINQHQYDALVSFAFNIGLQAFRGSAVLAHVNRGEPVAAALAMGAWRRANVNGQVIVVDALVRRRAAEAALFLEPTGARPAAPSPVVTPELDRSAHVLSPDAPSVTVEAPLEGEARAIVPNALEAATERMSRAADRALEAPRAAPFEAARDPGVSPFPGGEPEAPPAGVANAEPTAARPAANDAAPGGQPFPPAPPLPAGGVTDTGFRPFDMTRARGSAVVAPGPAGPRRLFLWALLGLGLAALAAGLAYAWQAGVLSLDRQNAAPLRPAEIGALAAATLGFVATVAAAMGLIGDPEA
jgi:lysozyme